MKRFLLLLAVPCGFLAVLIWMGIDAGRTTPGRTIVDGQLMMDPGSGRGPAEGDRRLGEPGVVPRDLSSVLRTARGDAEALRQVRSWYSHGRRPPLLARSLTNVPRGVLRGFQRGQSVAFPLPEGGSFNGVVRTAVESEPGLDVLGGRIVSPRAGFFHFEQKDDRLQARVSFKDDATVMLIFPVGQGSHAWVLEDRELTECAGAANDALDPIGGVFNTGVIQIPAGFDPWSLQSLPGAAGVILLDFDGHTVSNTIWVGSSRVDLQACKLEYSIVSPK